MLDIGQDFFNLSDKFSASSMACANLHADIESFELDESDEDIYNYITIGLQRVRLINENLTAVIKELEEINTQLKNAINKISEDFILGKH